MVPDRPVDRDAVAAPVSSDRTAADGLPRYDFVRVNAGFRIGYMPNRAFDTFCVERRARRSSRSTERIRSSRAASSSSARVLAGTSAGARRPSAASTRRVARASPLRSARGSLQLRALALRLRQARARRCGDVCVGEGPNDASTSSRGRAGRSPRTRASARRSWSGPRRTIDDKRAVRFWVTPELGYTYTTKAPLERIRAAKTRTSSAATRTTTCGRSPLSGFFWRATVGITY